MYKSSLCIRTYLFTGERVQYLSLASSPPRPLLFSQTYHNVQKEEIPRWANRKVSNASNLTTKLLTPSSILILKLRRNVHSLHYMRRIRQLKLGRLRINGGLPRTRPTFLRRALPPCCCCCYCRPVTIWQVIIDWMIMSLITRRAAKRWWAKGSEEFGREG